MKVFNNIRGTMKNVASVEVNIDTVYLRSNIKRIDEEDFYGWEYDEIQMPLQNYIQQITDLGQLLADSETSNLMLGQQVADLELKILEMGVK